MKNKPKKNIRTKIIVEREKDEKVVRRTYELPNDNPDGFFGTIEIIIGAGLSVSLSIPRETLEFEEAVMTKEEKDK